jgi:hypothetical protein
LKPSHCVSAWQLLGHQSGHTTRHVSERFLFWFDGTFRSERIMYRWVLLLCQLIVGNAVRVCARHALPDR